MYNEGRLEIDLNDSLQDRLLENVNTGEIRYTVLKELCNVLINSRPSIQKCIYVYLSCLV